MASKNKRFTDVDKWNREWFRKLDPMAKIAWFYLCDRCDHSGIWLADFGLASFQTGIEVTPEKISNWFGDKVRKISDDKYFVVAFFDFQYADAKDTFNAKISAKKNLQKLGLLDSPEESTSLDETHIKSKIKIKINLEEGVGETFGPKELAELWREIFAPEKPAPRFKAGGERWKSAKARTAEEPSPEYWRQVITKISQTPFCRGKNDRSWIADFDFLVRQESHIKVMEGKYDRLHLQFESKQPKTSMLVDS